MDPCCRCGGFVLNEYGTVRCLNCGNYLFEPFVPHEINMIGRIKPCYQREKSGCKNMAVDGHEHCQAHLDYFKFYSRLKRARLKGAA